MDAKNLAVLICLVQKEINITGMRMHASDHLCERLRAGACLTQMHLSPEEAGLGSYNRNTGTQCPCGTFARVPPADSACKYSRRKLSHMSRCWTGQR